MFRDETIRDWVKQIDFRESLEEEILFETIPEIDSGALATFFSSEPVTTIVVEIFTRNNQENSDLKEDFVKIFNTSIPIPDTCDKRIAYVFFRILVDTCNKFYSQKLSDQNSIALEALNEGRHKELKELIRNSKISEKIKFVPWRDYFNRVEKDLLPLEINLTLKRTELAIKKSDDFINNQYGKIQIFHTPGGFGKSFLLRQIAYELERKYPDSTVLSVNPSFPDISNALVTELDTSKKYLLLFDDADRWSDELASLFAYVRNQTSEMKVILTSRTAGLQSIKKVLKSQKCVELSEEIEIAEWNKEDLTTLLKIVLDGLVYEKEALIVETYPNPYLIVWIGNAIKNNPKIPFEKLQRKLVEDLEFEAFNLLTPQFTQETVKSLLIDLALISPFNKNDERILNLLSEKNQVPTEVIFTHLLKLENNGVLRVTGFSSRFNPDMKGDLYLADFVNNLQDSQILGQMINFWGLGFEDIILRNLESTAVYCKTNVLVEYFSQWVQDAIKSAEFTPGYNRMKNLEYLSRFCYLVPDESLDLLQTYINTAQPSISKEDFFWPDITLTKDNYGNIILRLIEADQSRKEIFDLIESVEKNVSGGHYDNQKIAYLVQETVNPLKNSLAMINETLSLLERRLDPSNDCSLLLLGIAVEKVLQREHDRSYMSSRRTVTIIRGQLPCNPEVVEMRNNAINILERMLLNENIAFRRKAIHLFHNLRTGGIGQSDLDQRIDTERLSVVAELEKLIKKENDFGVMSDIESLLLDWYRWSFPETKNSVEKILVDFPRKPKYVLFRSLFYSGKVLISFNPTKIPSDENSRSEWFNEYGEFISDPEIRSAQCQLFVNNVLIDEYPDVDSISRLLMNITQYQKNAELNALRLDQIMENWIGRRQDYFFEIHARKEIWGSLSQEIRNSIELNLCKFYPQLLEEVGNELLQSPQTINVRRISNFIFLIIQQLPEDQTNVWIRKFIEFGNVAVHRIILMSLPQLSHKTNNLNYLLSLSCEIWRKYNEIDETLLDTTITFELHEIDKHRNEIDNGAIESLRQLLFESMVSRPKINENPQHKYQLSLLLSFILPNANEIHSFITRRSMLKTEDRNYEILPNFDLSLITKIKSCADFNLILSDLLSLSNQKMISKRDFYEQVKPVLLLQMPDTDKLCLEVFVVYLLEIKKIDDAIILCSFLPFESNTEKIYSDVLELAVSLGKEKEASEMFDHNYMTHLLPEINGTVPPAIAKKEEFVKELYARAAPGKSRVLLRQVLNKIDHEKDFFIKEFEEISERY
jgi:hypothetical protein